MSKWHNPFRTGIFGRFGCIERYEKFAREYLWNDLHELDDQTLGCWCHPKACHGDVLKRLREEQLNATVNSIHTESKDIQSDLV